MLEGRNLVVVSGFARGTDAAAHEAALEAGLPTVAVLGAGIDVDYPSGHAGLRRRILETGGLIVSEFPAGTPPRASNFHRRNRLIAGWSSAIVVAQAAHRSGALNTAWWARRLERTCLAHPSPAGAPLFAGNQRLIDDEAALPLWHAHSLGAVWLELATLRPSDRPVRKGDLRGDPGRLDGLLRSLARESGGARAEDAFDFAARQWRWSPPRFHAALAALLKSGGFREEAGVVFPNVRNQTRNPVLRESVKS
jgi:predicted Rossmann fold nucleotide-binding protein DprA/Smf involved in DNA uptake